MPSRGGNKYPLPCYYLGRKITICKWVPPRKQMGSKRNSERESRQTTQQIRDNPDETVQH